MAIFAPPGVGSVVQMVSTLSTANATGTTTIPLDTTIPQNTEGNQFMTLAITPKSTTNNLVIQVVALASHSVNTGNIIMALFQDSTANALAATNIYQTTATAPGILTINHTMAAGTTSATTFKIRIGGNAAGTTTFNSGSGIGANLFGSITKSSIVIWEVIA